MYLISNRTSTPISKAVKISEKETWISCLTNKRFGWHIKKLEQMNMYNFFVCLNTIKEEIVEFANRNINVYASHM
ncbi:hypothetical protein RCL_jg14050.t1 [Rhizophagus clarus]|uniref:Uncharacterized protein n=1 Tax=Rhizophagus clarus TaxID=94130 RepID=A0A8H3LNB5_9GLOM|nr:hypothetical protein RCL_jg14050.t1 [Rhizophagus clarus]